MYVGSLNYFSYTIQIGSNCYMDVDVCGLDVAFRRSRDGASFESLQGGKRPGGETGSPLLGQSVMRRRTGTSAPSALPVQLMAAKNLLSTNRK